ncbi:MAG: SRPBCC family protein, partial [Mycobacteriaceae bacterium]|nr:SRPBCC family protein [Mycobacteriaceae bacterium]
MWMGMVGSGLAGAGLYAARRFYRNWGTTKEECQTPLPGDEMIGEPATQTTEGIWIEASAAAVWPWLVQIGQDRGGLYSFERLENLLGLRYRNADRIHPEWQRLAVGEQVRLAPRGWLGLRDGLTLPV